MELAPPPPPLAGIVVTVKANTGEVMLRDKGKDALMFSLESSSGPSRKSSMCLTIGFSNKNTAESKAHLGGPRTFDMGIDLLHDQALELVRELFAVYDANSNDSIEFDEWVQFYDAYLVDDAASTRLREYAKKRFENPASKAERKKREKARRKVERQVAKMVAGREKQKNIEREQVQKRKAEEVTDAHGMKRKKASMQGVSARDHGISSMKVTKMGLVTDYLDEAAERELAERKLMSNNDRAINLSAADIQARLQVRGRWRCCCDSPSYYHTRALRVPLLSRLPSTHAPPCRW